MGAANTLKNLATAGATVKAYQEKTRAQIQEGKAILDQLEARAREKKAQAEIKAIDGLRSAKQNIDRKVQDLTATHRTNVPRAKADIDEEIATFKSRIDDLGARLKAQSGRK